MTRKPETILVGKIREELGRRGFYSIKIHGDMFQPDGESDLICCVNGRFVALEVKVKGNEPSAKQKYIAKLVRAAGGIAETVWSVEDAVRVIHNVRDASIRDIRSQDSPLGKSGEGVGVLSETPDP